MTSPRERFGIEPRSAVDFAALVALYVAAAKVGIELSVAHGVVTPVWAPTGIAIAGLFLLGLHFWPAVALAAFVANATSGASIPEAAAISVGNTLEAVVGSVLLLRVGFLPAMSRVRDVLALISLGAIVATVIAATNGVTALWLFGTIPGSSWASEWLLWWIGDAMGALIVAPFLLVWSTRPLRGLTRGRQVEALALLVALVGLSSFVFLAGYWRYPHLLFPLLIWAVLRFGQAGAVTGSLVVAAIAIAGAVDGSTPLGDRSPTDVVQILEGLLAALAISLLTLGAVLAGRAEAEHRLERARGTLAEAQEVAHVGSWEWDVRANRVAWSDELYRLFGLEPQSVEITYESFLALVHPEDRERVRENVERAGVDGQPFEHDHRLVLPDGRIRWLHGRGRVIADASGRSTRMLGTSQDVTERKRLDELRDSILSTVSHELRTPLTSILGFATTLHERGGQIDPATQSQMVRHLVVQSQRLERLLTDLLDLERLRRGFERLRLQETDIAQLVTRVAAGTETDGHALDLRVEPAVAEVDAPKVERIVENLLVNAVKHTPPGTQIQVGVERRDDGVIIAVDDRGPGIAEGQREAIFEIFNRGDSDLAHAPGTGIGLSLVEQFTALHGGRVWVEENPGGGASFRVFLPATRPR